ncbi:MAG: hypothetical protein AAFY48_21940 [Bacteroidota bacterium]
MKRVPIYAIGLLLLIAAACKKNRYAEVATSIPDFNFPKTVVFEESLLAYDVFVGPPADLTPDQNFQLLELSSVLFTDHAHKQRLVKIPAGTQMTRSSNGAIDFPDGTILAKTFYYYHDERNPSLGKRIIETRLLIKDHGLWNVATYLWNEAQSDATLALSGFDTQVSWINADGLGLSTLYHVPSENECMTCHQSNSSLTPLGPTSRNLNRLVERNGANLNQISHLQSIGVLHDFPINQVPEIVNYNDLSASLIERGRAYLAMNCAHCHHPSSWEATTERDFDFRYDIPLKQTGILYGKDKIVRAVMEGEMPFIGTTMIDQEGVALITSFVESL